MPALIVITGAPGTGKTTLMHELSVQGMSAIGEPARQILAEQRAQGGQGLPELNAGLFLQLILDRSVEQYQAAASQTETAFFDRGIPDSIAYARHFGLSQEQAIKAATEFRYHPRVFICPPWETIYKTDSERKMGFAAVHEFHADLIEVYRALDYEICELPRINARERARFLLDQLQTARK